MASAVYISVTYGIVRLALWVALFAAAVADGARHRRVRSRGWQLYLLLVISAFLFVLKNIAFLAICIEAGGDDEGWATPAAYGSYIFFGNVAESFWIFLLLSISAGLCITRSDWGPHKTVCFVIPTIFLITAFIVDYVLFAQAGIKAFDYKTAYASSVPPEGYDPETYDPATDPLSGVSETTGFVFVFCSLANFMAFFMSWFYMYDTARSEWQALANAGASGAQGPLPPSLSYPSDVIPPGGDSAGVGHAAVPTNAALLEEGQNASHLYGDVVGEDLDVPKTVQDRVADRDKVRLMKQFFIAVSVYLCCAVLVFFLPLFVPMGVDAALLVAYDALLLIFLGGLLVVFRMRESNQFLLLEEGGDGDGGPETTTELGVMYRDDDEEAGAPAGVSAVRTASGAAPGVSGVYGQQQQQQQVPPPTTNAAAKYSLGDDDDDEDGEIVGAGSSSGGGGGGGGRSASVAIDPNASAAAHGVVVQPLPSPQG